MSDVGVGRREFYVNNSCTRKECSLCDPSRYMQGGESSSGSVYGVVFRQALILLTELMMAQHSAGTGCVGQ